VPEDVPVKGLRRVELRSNDPAGSADYYRALFGWIVMPADDGTVRCWVGDRLAALIRRPVEWETPGWHVVLGGRPTALLADPAGVTATLDPGRVRHGPWAPPPRHGEPCWVELMTADTTDDYWAQHLGWTLRAPGEGADIKPFALFDAPDDTGARAIAGRLLVDEAIAADMGTSWMCYLAATDIQLVTDTAAANGGTVLIDPREVPTGVMAAVADPFGTVCTLLEDPIGWGGAWAAL
jgi:predicted enzyme related to lactoylglutathione lyase